MTHTAENAMDTCNAHLNKKVTLYCKSCKKYICTECVKSRHIDHDWDATNSVANERRAYLPAWCKDIREKKIPMLRKMISGKPKEDEDDEFLKELDHRRLSIITVIRKFTESKKQKYYSLKYVSEISDEEVKEMLKYMDKITISLDENVHTYSDMDVLEMEQEMLSTLEKLETLKLEKEKVKTFFRLGQLNEKALDDMIGDVMVFDRITQSAVNITETRTIQNAVGLRIHAVKNERLWIGDGSVKLFDNNWKTIQTMQYKCDYYVIMNNGDHVYTDAKCKEVRVTSTDGVERTVCSATPLVPTWINKTRDGDILVSMIDDGEPYIITSKSRRLIQRISMAGDVLKSYEFREDGKGRLFILPCRSAENRNGDICSVNRTSGDFGELIILHRDGRIRASYSGLNDAAQPFRPFDVECDSKCRIIVSDPDNKSVHLLSYDGTFLRYLLSGLEGRPLYVSLCDECLWLSILSSNSTILIAYTYR